ncbi:unnamed protein product [Bursaphelenchus okinawaensis]|uniref:Origin recognition complex subunit 4 n=1 Tax=Bursaphelenchus okinawaensis TaxID=465554 RepID=A0A811LUP3_9BILA|nr:unnamed protein product [Bursaphelenchus okinawaensis]CAG9127929.1 unnamed protein product [Bursaphelenchus okinawaensis]
MKLTDGDRDKILKNIAEYYYDSANIEAFLLRIFEPIIEQRTGASVTLLGPPGCGKRTVIRQFVASKSTSKKKVHLIEHNASLDDLISTKERLRQLDEILDGDKSATVCYVIYNFEHFKGTFGNNVLYTLAQKVRCSPLLLILVGESQKGLTIFEKRIASRLSGNTLRIIPDKAPEKCWEFLQNVMETATKGAPKTVQNALKINFEMPVNFYQICRGNPVYGNLKLIAKELVDIFFDEKGELSVEEILTQVIKERVGTDIYDELLDMITDRQFGLLMCAAIKTERVHLFFPCRYLYSEYKRFINLTGIPHRSNLYMDEHSFEADVRDLVYKKFFGAKYQGSRIIMLCWNLNPLQLIEPAVREKFVSKISHFVDERGQNNFMNLRV